MSFLVSSVLPFPSIFWWVNVLRVDCVLWDKEEHFEKMSYRNRYNIATSNGLMTMSIPLNNGRDQKSAVKNISISYAEDWQKHQFKTLASAYNSSPFFEHYAPELELIFSEKYEHLVDFNYASVQWLKQKLKLKFDEQWTSEFQKEYSDATIDLRHSKPKLRIEESANMSQYQQVFQDKNGFIPNLSILDLLFDQGPYSRHWLASQKLG